MELGLNGDDNELLMTFWNVPAEYDVMSQITACNWALA
jgi:hypothetical protein